MNVPLDILDHIFGYLIPHPASLVAFSEAHPVFSQMVEKFHYHHITIDPQSTCFLTKLLSDKPRIANYVRILRIDGEPGYPSISITKSFFERIAVILPLFSVLECIVLSYADVLKWERDLPQIFQKAMEDCLRLPTMRELHIERYFDCFPVSMLDNNPNIDSFSLCGTPKIVSNVADITTCPQLKSLSINGFFEQHQYISFSTWAKPRITRLQYLKYNYSSDETLLELLKICSDTLTTLDITLDDTVDNQHSTTSFFNSHTTPSAPILINLPPHLQDLTIHALIRFICGDDNPYERYESFLPAAIEIIKVAPSLDLITLEINVDLTDADHSYFDDVDLSPLAALADSPRSFRHIDLHFNVDWDLADTKLVSLLTNVRGLSELIEQGVLDFEIFTPDF